MSIRKKSMLVVSVTLVVLIGALSITLGRVMMSGFRTVENREATQNVHRVLDAIDVQLQGIESSLFTWTQWDAAYQYMADRSDKFLKDNVSETMYTGMKIDYCLFLDPKHELIYAGGYDFEAHRNLPVPAELVATVQHDSKLLANQDASHSVRGILNLKGTSLYVVAAPVTNTAGNAPARGHIVFVRVLDPSEVARLSTTTHLAVALTRPAQPGDGIRVAPRDAHTIDGVTSLADLQGRPALQLTVGTPRDVYQQGQRSLRMLIASIIVIGLIFGAVMYLVISRLVLKRVLDMSHRVVGMTESLDFTQPLDVKGNDEISALGTAINGMACAVAEVLSALDHAA